MGATGTPAAPMSGTTGCPPGGTELRLPPARGPKPRCLRCETHDTQRAFRHTALPTCIFPPARPSRPLPFGNSAFGTPHHPPPHHTTPHPTPPHLTALRHATPHHTTPHNTTAAWGHWAVELLQYTAESSGQWNPSPIHHPPPQHHTTPHHTTARTTHHPIQSTASTALRHTPLLTSQSPAHAGHCKEDTHHDPTIELHLSPFQTFLN